MPVDAAFKMKAAAMTCRRRLQCLTRNRLRSIAFTQHSRGNRLYELKYVVKTLAIWKRFVLMQRERENRGTRMLPSRNPTLPQKYFLYYPSPFKKHALALSRWLQAQFIATYPVKFCFSFFLHTIRKILSPRPTYGAKVVTSDIQAKSVIKTFTVLLVDRFSSSEL